MFSESQRFPHCFGDRACLAAGGLQRGFTLLEVIVAFTIFAVTFTSVLQILSTSTRNEEIAINYGLAVSHAESLLAKAGVEAPLRAGETTGALGQGMQWKKRVARYGSGAATESSKVIPYSIAVTVTWGEGEAERSVTLSTLRLGRAG